MFTRLDGKIGKVIDICTCEQCEKRGYYEPTIEYSHNERDYVSVYWKDNLKASHNIIDLIEVGDLIEHENIGIKQIKDKDKYSQYIWYSKNHNPSTCDIEDAISFEAFKSEFEVGNISIVTKEQFESMSYRVGSEE